MENSMDRQSRYVQMYILVLCDNFIYFYATKEDLIFFFPFSEFEDDPDLYVLKPINYVGIEVWQV